LANFDPPPCHTLSNIPRPAKKYVTHLGHPPFSVGLVQKTWTKTPCTNSHSIVHGGFCPGVLSGALSLEGFVRGGFCPFPLLSEYICYNRKFNITLNFKFHMYDKIFFISVTS